jgi:glycosyltransferase involved in cell wall biosynthesis
LQQQRSKHITVLVSNDLQFDQRVAKVCDTLLKLGYRITLVGRKLSTSTNFERAYEIKRFNLFFERGALFYAALNIRLFFYLLFKKTDVILANDLDTLFPAFLVSRIRDKHVVYDSHEYFTEAEGLTGRNFQKKTWLMIEKFIFPKLKYVYTVNESIAEIYRKLYNTDVKVVRNIPLLNPIRNKRSRHELGLPEDKKIILLQGAFIDPDRGGKELVESMQYVNGALLLIIGSGREIETLKRLVVTLGLDDKVWIKGKMPFEELRQFTANADLGVSLDKPLHLNYTLSLPNKLFDYIHAGTPVIVSDLPELRRVVSEYEVGLIVPSVEPKIVAEYISKALAHEHYERWKSNCLKARESLNWQHESEVLQKIYSNFI